jgi:hypothetical protein
MKCEMEKILIFNPFWPKTLRKKILDNLLNSSKTENQPKTKIFQSSDLFFR